MNVTFNAPICTNMQCSFNEFNQLTDVNCIGRIINLHYDKISRIQVQ